MAGTGRRRIPSKVADNLMFRNRHTCCICHEKGKAVQIHHIDADPSNNSPGNLAVLCLDCHSQVTSDAGLGRSHTVGEVRKYKHEWESLTSTSTERLGLSARDVEEELLKADITRLMIEAISLNDSPRKLESIAQIENYSIHFEVREFVLKALYSILLGSVWSEPESTAACASTLHHLFWGFAGPERVPFKEEDERDFKEALNLLQWIAEHATEEMRSPIVQISLMESLEYLYELAAIYDRADSAMSVLDVIGINLDKCYSELEFEGPWSDGVRFVLKALKSAKNVSPTIWEHALTRIEELRKKAREGMPE